MSIHNIRFLIWNYVENYSLIIIKYPPYLSEYNKPDSGLWVLGGWSSVLTGALCGLSGYVSTAIPFNENEQNCNYRNDPEFSDRQVWANSVEPDQTALFHCLLFRLHLLDLLLNGKAMLFKF